jgi:hypothetical protein
LKLFWKVFSQLLVSGAGAESEVRTGAGEGGGVRVAGRENRDRISRGEVALEGNHQRTAAAVGRVGTGAVSGCGLRWALNAPHKTRRRAPLRPQPETEEGKNNQMPKHKKGDISNEVTKGTF